jgi:hypothetical protein
MPDRAERAAFDVKYEKVQAGQFKNFSEAPFITGFEADQKIRHSILPILYL